MELCDYEQVVACKSSFISNLATTQNRKLAALLNEITAEQTLGNVSNVNNGSFQL